MDLREPYSRTRTYASACHITPVKGANESDGDKWANSYPGIEITIFGDNARYSASESGGFVRGIHGFNKHRSLQNEHRAHAHQAYRKKIQRVVQMHENCVLKLAKLDMEGFFSPFAQKRR